MGEPASPGAPGPTTVTYLGHASLLVEASGETLLTDPVFSGRIARIFTKRTRPSGFRPEELRGLRGVVLSHAHHDHLDYASLRRIGRTHPLVVPWGVATALRWRGFTDVRVLRPWEGLSLGRWRVVAVPSRHFGGRLPFVFTSGYQGYVLDGPSCIYFAADTGFDEAMFREIGRRFALDLAVLPIAGAVFPWFRRNHMNAEEALRAFRLLGAAQMLPIHFDTFPASFEPAGRARRTLVDAAARLASPATVTLLEEGQSLRLGAAVDRAPFTPDRAPTVAPVPGGGHVGDWKVA
ncbi:MAG: MBL fold metallo-hydrolase [Thermoplasmata archaeon]|nr:MBL fold metallo-hydrolase [Thermoplasmata archaeon]